MKFLYLFSLFILVGWKSSDESFKEDKSQKLELMKLKAKKLRKVLGEDAEMPTNCWSKKSKHKKETSEYDHFYPYTEDIDL